MPTIYHVSGDMDAGLMVSLRADLEFLAQGDGDVEIDMRNVSFIDSSGIGGLVFLYKRLVKQGRNLTVKNLNSQPLQMFNYLQLTDLLTLPIEVIESSEKSNPLEKARTLEKARA
jgi:anti-sigma B factor antagonist